METKNFGLIVDPVVPEDFLGGTSQSLEAKYGGEELVPDGDWSPYTPSTEDQDTTTGDTFACVSHGTLNAVEMLARRRFSDIKNLSDRFLAKISGTVVGQGNSPKTVADALRHKWSVNEIEWPDVETVAEFYAEIPAHLKTVAVARGAEFEFGYQYITNSPTVIKEALKRSPVCIAVTAWMQGEGSYIRIPSAKENHWTTIIKVLPNGNYLCFDSFAPFIKEVHPAACQSVAMSYYLNRQVVVESAWKKFIKDLLAWVFSKPLEEPVKPRETPQDEPKPPQPTVPTTPPAPSRLEAFCEAIKVHEGWYPGSRSFRNNNPGNARFSSVGYLAKYEPVLRDPQGFAVFKDYAIGWLYLQNLVREYVRKHPDWTLLDFFKTYAPAEDHNDPNAYAAAVGKRLGVDYKTFVISKLL
jgi:hypothetical protein